MAKRKWHGVTRQQVENADEIIAWLKATGGTPLEVGVMEELRERLKVQAHSGAIVRIRIKNLGGTPYQRKTTGTVTALAGSHAPRAPRLAWTFDEIEHLRKLYEEGLTHAQIGERLGRTAVAVRERVGHLQLRRTRPYSRTGNNKTDHPAQSVLARARALRERRLAEGRLERREA